MLFPQMKKALLQAPHVNKICNEVLSRVNADFFSRFIESFKLDNTVNQRKQSKVLSQTDIVARMYFCSYLPHNDRPGVDFFTAEYFYATSLRIAVSAVAGTSLTFSA